MLSAPFFMWQKISNVGAILGILGISGNSLWGEAYKAHIALAAFITACAILVVYGIFTLRKFQATNYPKGYIPVATFVRYSTTDGKQIVHEQYRQIQIKHAFLTQIQHRYLWSGTKKPTFTSKLQEIGSSGKDALTGFDVLDVKFRHPRYYNETEIIHLRSSIDDADEKSGTFLQLLIENPIKIVQFRVELLHCVKASHSGMMAYIERCKAGYTNQEYEIFDTIPFSLTSRAFEYILANPEPGWSYRLRWNRPTIAAIGRRKTDR